MREGSKQYCGLFCDGGRGEFYRVRRGIGYQAKVLQLCN